MWGLSSPPPTIGHRSKTNPGLRNPNPECARPPGRSRAREAKEEAAATAPPRPYSEWPQVQAEHKTQMEQLRQKLQKEGVAKKLSEKKVSQLKQKQKDESNRMTGLHLRELKRLKRR